MLSIESFGIALAHPEHLNVGNLEVLLGLCDYFADVKICVWLNHSIGSAYIPSYRQFLD